jgi:hypothetical protein
LYFVLCALYFVLGTRALSHQMTKYEVQSTKYEVRSTKPPR